MVSSGGINRDALANSGSSNNGYLSDIRYQQISINGVIALILVTETSVGWIVLHAKR